MTDERNDLPEVLQTPPGDPGMGSGGSDGVSVSAGDGGVPLPREDQPGEDEPDVGVGRDQAERQAWLRAAEGLIMSYWHDPRTAIKYCVAVLHALGDPEIDYLTLDPMTITPISQTDVGWR